ncbi:hypothetical protein AJ79_07495 [Helicocarpus griseus UAMH5409]|uniref:Uncharacterized protein n=1 Tax=Helicocarpus griseus UAMH5409 TaxID=1447875 RepID=A0A2B7X2P5_9EURO|nr:hypothetical protein AJ79_07495 [Helicocarpus griseus UAMH5409]
MSAIRALLYPLKHLLNASPVPKLHICSFACRTFEDLVKLDDIYRMAHNVLSNGYIDADGQYSSSHASSRVGLYFSAFSQFSPHIDLHVHDEGHEHHVFFSGSGEFKTANYQTLDEWEDEEKLFFWCKTWPATKSAPHMGYLDDAELENYGVAMTYSHRYLVLRLAVSSRKFWWNIFDLYDGIQNPPENNRDELIVRDDSWRGTRPYSWWPGKEVDVAAFLNRWALYETGNKPIQRKITEFFQPLFG